jgi:hypothetical protein
MGIDDFWLLLIAVCDLEIIGLFYLAIAGQRFVRRPSEIDVTSTKLKQMTLSR